MAPMTHNPEKISQLCLELRERRQEIRAVHDRGLSGVLVSAKLASLVDRLVVSLFESIANKLPSDDARALRSNLTIVSLGSHGRRQCAPFSDVDLIFLYQAYHHTELAELLRPLTQGMFDIGFQLGYSIRTIREAIQLSQDDTTVCTSLCDARLLLGNQKLFNEFRADFERMLKGSLKPLSRDLLETRNHERNEYGESIYLLEPHVKRSRGGLRDLNVLRWLAFMEFGVSDIDRLHLMGAVSKFDYHRLQNATAFLLRLRNEMHFHADLPNDMLDRAEQIRVADRLGYRHATGLLPVERFMRDYFRHTNHVWQLVRRRQVNLEFQSAVTRVLSPIRRKNVDRDFIVGSRSISTTPAGLAKVKRNLKELLRLVSLSVSTGKPIDQVILSSVAQNAPEIDEEIPIDVRAELYELLGNIDAVGDSLTLLHELGILEKFVPAMRHARFLLQFNQYHKYTVDEHCIRSVHEATRFALRNDTLKQVYDEIIDKRILHLALLLHDLGKGFDEDHSEVGKRIAESTAELFGLDSRSTSNLVFLVHKHLLLSHLTFRRDTSETRLLEEFVKDIGDPERLRMLFVLTCADLAAVGPGVLSEWKVEVLTAVYQRALAMLQPSELESIETKSRSQRASVLRILSEKKVDKEWCERQLSAIPSSFLAGHSPEQVSGTLAAFERLSPNEVIAWCTAQPRTDSIECIAGADHGVGKGLFSRMAGVLSGEGLQIVSASTDVLANELLMLRYTAVHPKGINHLRNEYLAEISAKLIDSAKSDATPRFRRVWGQEQREASQRLTRLPDRVTTDNSQSDKYTIVEIFTFDREGLLYQLSRLIHDLQLVIRHAKIATYLDQVVDVFYLSHRNGNKVNEVELGQLKERIYEVIREE